MKLSEGGKVTYKESKKKTYHYMYFLLRHCDMYSIGYHCDMVN